MQTRTVEHKETKKERRQRQLSEHYVKCEALARRLGKTHPIGKRISSALLRLEHKANNAATAQCNGEPYQGEPYRNEEQWEAFKGYITFLVNKVLGSIPPGFFVNGDARGYALKIDNENPQGKALIEELRLHRDWGGYGILSPEIE